MRATHTGLLALFHAAAVGVAAARLDDECSADAALEYLACTTAIPAECVADLVGQATEWCGAYMESEGGSGGGGGGEPVTVTVFETAAAAAPAVTETVFTTATESIKTSLFEYGSP
jgi:hypothetical protein